MAVKESRSQLDSLLSRSESMPATITGAYPEIWIRGASPPPSPLPSRPLPNLPSRPSSPLPLEVGPLNPARGLGSAVSSPVGVWGGALAKIEFGTF